MEAKQANNPLHGITLEAILTELVNHYGFETLATFVNIRCFIENPSIKSSLTFLRKTPWARERIEGIYLKYLRQQAKAAKANLPKSE